MFYQQSAPISESQSQNLLEWRYSRPRPSPFHIPLRLHYRTYNLNKRVIGHGRRRKKNRAFLTKERIFHASSLFVLCPVASGGGCFYGGKCYGPMERKLYEQGAVTGVDLLRQGRIRIWDENARKRDREKNITDIIIFSFKCIGIDLVLSGQTVLTVQVCHFGHKKWACFGFSIQQQLSLMYCPREGRKHVRMHTCRFSICRFHQSSFRAPPPS